jgi:hypothetical protein
VSKIAPAYLDVALLGQLPAAHLPFGNQFEPRPIEVIGFQAVFGARALVEESLKHRARPRTRRSRCQTRRRLNRSSIGRLAKIERTCDLPRAKGGNVLFMFA